MYGNRPRTIIPTPGSAKYALTEGVCSGLKKTLFVVYADAKSTFCPDTYRDNWHRRVTVVRIHLRKLMDRFHISVRMSRELTCFRLLQFQDGVADPLRLRLDQRVMRVHLYRPRRWQ